MILKDCPFCGSKAIIRNAESAWVECTNQVCAAISDYFDSEDEEQNMEDAASSWNAYRTK